jgi:hypothetical protein
MTPEVTQAIKEIAVALPDCRVESKDDGQGGAVVTVHNVPLAGSYQQSDTWVGFHVTHPYPYCDVYPHFIRADLSRKDGRALSEGMQVANFQGQPAIQISRRSNRHNPAIDTAALKLLKVLKWMNGW